MRRYFALVLALAASPIGQTAGEPEIVTDRPDITDRDLLEAAELRQDVL